MRDGGEKIDGSIYCNSHCGCEDTKFGRPGKSLIVIKSWRRSLLGLGGLPERRSLSAHQAAKPERLLAGKIGYYPRLGFMLNDRVYRPQKGDLLFHYCDADSLAAICDSRRIRLSDLFSMNDFMEMHWGYHIWELAAGKVLDDVGKGFLDKIDEVIHLSGYHTLLVGSSFSLDGDVLSQWRAYSSDGTGYAIGFDGEIMSKLQVRPLRVLYDEDRQIEEAVRFIKSIFVVEEEENEKFGEDFFEACAVFAADLAAFKNPAFIEEKEIRLVHALSFQKSNDFLKLVDEGGTAFEEEVSGEQIGFRMKGETPTAFIDIDFTNGGIVNPIRQVVLGPKNAALPTGISVYLETIGIGSVVVKKSAASYR